MKSARTAVAFTLVELLVVIGIIGVLVGVLLPVLGKARESANTIKCSSNLRSVGQGVANFIANNKGKYPPSYRYNMRGGGIASSLEAEPTSPSEGYTHWSWFLYGEGKTPAESFRCPSLPNEGGLPPTNPRPEDRIPGQSFTSSAYDNQVRRVAYALNEAVCGRNKFHEGVGDSSGGSSVARLSIVVTASSVRKSAETILATEYSEVMAHHMRSDGDAGDGIVRSHRPVHAFRDGNGATDLNQVPVSGAEDNLGRSAFKRVRPSEVRKVIPPPPAALNNRLELVGRNHGRDPKTAKTNFLYCDGHVETKTIEETLRPSFQWGEQVYSVRPSSVDTGLPYP